jgi:t-SNARE complex subunit (syntaxin)
MIKTEMKQSIELYSLLIIVIIIIMLVLKTSYAFYVDDHAADRPAASSL